ncbi:MAG: endospore germination permease [Clostridia bacterium]|nr:endospore germination permease [Clostridia bacterium]
MTSKASITTTQLMMLAVGSSFMFPYTFMPILNAPPANQDVWLVLLLSIVYIVIMCSPILFIANKFRGLTVNEITEVILGKFAGKLASFLFVLLFLFCYAACLSMAAIFVKIAIIPETPTWAFIAFAVVPISYATYKGAGTIGRLATFIVPFIMFTIIIFFLMGIPQIDLKVLQPVFADSTFLDINKGALITSSRLTEKTIFLVFSYFLIKEANINKTFIKALLLYNFFYALILLPTLLVLGVDLAQNAFNPYFVYTRQVHGYDFIEKVQALNTLAWFPGLMLKLTLYNFMGCYMLSGIFKMKSHKSFVIPFSVLAAVFCLIPAINKADIILTLASDQIFPWIVFPFTFVLPLILVIVYLIRKKKLDNILQYIKQHDLSSQCLLLENFKNDGNK